ncbi:FG-GAP repeat domain-containing protein [Streptomyces sp. H34-S4]|uniref:FG-GAP repeat domain-containing protein n=1 Tax=Streptomyces sp. H34-S4 TaxID=2996463 RepID=UPI00226EDA07|nr:VCBS repeat-containing protein [Streptomyces sp. H34-S4]MCY0938051.1 VCBS repeat-containing protein [Streptomyces sp. H34-S4]
MNHRRAGAHAPRSLAALLALALPLTAATLLTEPAAAAAEATVADSSTAASGAPKSASEVEAVELARKSGEQVEIIDRRTETSETYANPDGSLTQKQFTLPVWTRHDGLWRKTDDTVIKREDGTIGPTAAFGITFSAGGDGPMVEMDKEGKKLALGWPGKLPEPVLGENTALYKSVLPDVDLKLIAKVNGFAQHLIIKTPEAATNPALKTIKLAITSIGVTLDDDASDQLLAKDAGGRVVFSAPKPKMWEQPEPAATEAPVPLAKSAAPSLYLAEEPEPAPKGAPVAADVTANTLTLTPDSTLLASATQFPLVIDPDFDGGWREKWAVVYSATPNADYPNGSGWNSSNPADEPRVGYNGDGDTESFFAMNTNGLQGATIQDATFAVEQTHSWGCDPAAAGYTQLWTSKDISTTPTWNTRNNYWGYKLDEGKFAHGNPTYCPGVEGYDFKSASLTALVQESASKGWHSLFFGLRVPYTGDVNTFKRLRNNPVLQVTYNFLPEVLSSGAFEGFWAAGADGNKPVPCGGSIGNSGLAMTATLRDRDSGYVTAIFKVKNSAGGDVSFPSNYKTVWTGGTAFATVDTDILSSGTYSWQVYALDEENTKSYPPTPWCSFTVDKTGPPLRVTVTREDKKDLDTTDHKARTPLRLKLYNPATDLAGFCWRLDIPISISSTPCEGSNWVPLATGVKEAVIEVVPTGRPQSTLYIIAFDKAGNRSPTDGTKAVTTLKTVSGGFVYPNGKSPLDGKAVRDLKGDLNGDGHVDMLATAPDGRLRVYSGNGTGHVTGSVIGSGGWENALIAHGGDFMNFTSPTAAPDGYEDAIVRLGTDRLYRYPGDGQGSLSYAGRVPVEAPSRLNAEGWGRLQQIIAPGDIDQRTDTGHAQGNDLLALECTYVSGACVNVALRIYTGITINDGGADQSKPFDLDNPATLAGPTGGWGRMTVLGVGDQNNDGIKDILARDTLNNSLHLYRGKMTNGVYSLERGTDGQGDLYGSSGWGDDTRPLLATSGNAQGVVVDKTANDDGSLIPYKQFQVKAGDEPGDLWATTPSNADYPVRYVDSAGNSQTASCPTGCLLFYPGGPSSSKSPLLVGSSGWSSSINGIF